MTTQKLCLQDVSVQNKKVLIRVDFNVPLNADGTISDDTRIREALPSILHVLKAGGSVILMSHMGRPKAGPDRKLSLRPCAQHLSTLLSYPVHFAADVLGPQAENLAANLKPGHVLVLENLRFYPAEERPELDPSFAKNLAKLGDVYVNDAFGTAHRAHSSTATIAQFFPEKAAAGLLIQKEINFLGNLLAHPKSPFYALIGGSKISSKLGVLKSLLNKVNGLFIGGGMAYTFFKALGISIGDSICEDKLEEALSLIHACEKKNIKLWLPQDIVVTQTFNKDAPSQIVSIQEGIPTGWQGMDIGPQTIALWQKDLHPAATVFWNGPMGVFEFPRFAKGTQAIAKTVANLNAVTVVGGGDSVAAINELDLAKKFSHVSTGGGASLEFLEQGHLPGIDALSDSNKIS